MKKGEIYEGTITEYDFPNKGILVLDDRKVTIKGAFLGQKVEFSISKLRNGRAEGRLLKIIEKSSDETAKEVCSHFGNCGGCMYQTFSYEKQLKMKEQQVKKLIFNAINTANKDIKNEMIEDFEDQKEILDKDFVWEGIKGSPLCLEYRNKMEFSFGDEFKGGPLSLGLHKKGSFHDIVNINDCAIVDKDFDLILKCVQVFYSERNVPFYKKMLHEGILRHLVIRQSAKTKDILINLVATTEDIQALDLENLKEALLKLPLKGKIVGIIYTKNDSFADAVQSDGTVVVYGQDFFYEYILGLKFKISPFSFFQTNSLGAEVLYETARNYVGETKDKVIFDLYSGTGTIAQMLAPVAKKVVGVEIVEEAVEAAKVNAQLNNLTNCEFIAGDVLKVIDSIEDKPDFIVLDPPRDGINPKALDKIINFGVEQMVYISCKPTSLARDLEILQARGYKVVKGCAVDMFPMTGHVETIVALHRTNS